MQPIDRARGNSFVLIAFTAWFLLAFAAGASGAVPSLRPPAPQLLLLGLTVATLIAAARVPALREWVAAADIRSLVALHVTRFVGAYFLVLYRAGQLPWDFAVPGGVGDILVATFALVLVAAWDPRRPGARRLYVIWNIAGIIDITL